MKVDLFSIGKFTVHTYGVMIAIGIISVSYTHLEQDTLIREQMAKLEALQKRIEELEKSKAPQQATYHQE